MPRAAARAQAHDQLVQRVLGVILLAWLALRRPERTLRSRLRPAPLHRRVPHLGTKLGPAEARHLLRRGRVPGQASRGRRAPLTRAWALWGGVVDLVAWAPRLVVFLTAAEQPKLLLGAHARLGDRVLVGVLHVLQVLHGLRAVGVG